MPFVSAWHIWEVVFFAGLLWSVWWKHLWLAPPLACKLLHVHWTITAGLLPWKHVVCILAVRGKGSGCAHEWLPMNESSERSLWMRMSGSYVSVWATHLSKSTEKMNAAGGIAMIKTSWFIKFSYTGVFSIENRLLSIQYYNFDYLARSCTNWSFSLHVMIVHMHTGFTHLTSRIKMIEICNNQRRGNIKFTVILFAYHPKVFEEYWRSL